MSKLTSLLLILTTLILSGCPGNTSSLNCELTDLNLEARVTVAPVKDTYSKGDTVKINIRFPVQIIEITTNDLVSLISLDIRQRAFTNRIWPDSTILESDATKYVSFHPSNGSGEVIIEMFSNFSFAKGDLERLNDGSYELDYAVTLDSSGTYWFKLGQFIQSDEPAEIPIVVSNACGDARYAITYNFVNIPDENFALLCEADPPIGVCSVPLDESRIMEFRRSASCVFKVE